MIVNFNKIKCLKLKFFNGFMNSIYIKYTSHKQVIKSGAAIVNTISSLF